MHGLKRFAPEKYPLIQDFISFFRFMAERFWYQKIKIKFSKKVSYFEIVQCDLLDPGTMALGIA